MNENSFNTPEKNWAFADVKEYVVPPNSTSLCTVNGVVYNKDKTVLVKYPSAKTDTSFTVPETVTAIAPGAFYHAKHLRTIILNNVNTFGALSFAESQIESIIIPAGLTEVPEQCFAHCWSLVSVSFADDTCETIGSKAFYDNYDLSPEDIMIMNDLMDNSDDIKRVEKSHTYKGYTVHIYGMRSMSMVKG